MVAGYSGTTLVRKLGIKSGQRLAFVNQPKGYGETLGPMPDGVKVARLPDGPLDFIHLFTTSGWWMLRSAPWTRPGPRSSSSSGLRTGCNRGGACPCAPRTVVPP